MYSLFNEIISVWGPGDYKFGTIMTESGAFIRPREQHEVHIGWQIREFEIAKCQSWIMSVTSGLMGGFPQGSPEPEPLQAEALEKVLQNVNYNLDVKAGRIMAKLESGIHERLDAEARAVREMMEALVARNKDVALHTATANAASMFALVGKRVSEAMSQVQVGGSSKLADEMESIRTVCQELEGKILSLSDTTERSVTAGDNNRLDEMEKALQSMRATMSQCGDLGNRMDDISQLSTRSENSMTTEMSALKTIQHRPGNPADQSQSCTGTIRGCERYAGIGQAILACSGRDCSSYQGSHGRFDGGCG